MAPSLAYLGGQAVQAQRLLTCWRGDPDVDAWLVPHDPPPPRLLGFAKRIKFVRTAVNQATYLPLLVSELQRADVVHVFSASYSSFLLAPLPAIQIARVLGKPVVLNYRSGEASDHLSRSAIARRAIARVDRNVVPSKYLVDVFAAFGIEATIVPNVVDLSRFRFSERQPLRPRLLSTRNFDGLYNVACTLRAFRIVQDRYPDASLTLVGGGPNESRLRALAGDLGLAGLVFAGRVAPDRIHEQYASHDIYLQSPDIDNMPASVIEAFASGLPVVSTRAGGIPAILTDGVHGLLAPLDDHRMLASHVCTLLEQPRYASSLARAARDTCVRYEWSAVRQQWLDVYASLLPARSSAPSSAPDRLRPVGLLTGTPPK
ncbi:MAG: glycosyltransferase family 4 protein [Vicinamibacterales bacterium]